MAESKPPNHVCLECGALYNNIESVLKHMNKCDNDETHNESEASTERVGSESESVWEDMVQQIYDENDDKFQEKIEEYELRGESDAEKRASDDLRPIYKKELQKFFYNLFKYSHRLSKSRTYEKSPNRF